MIGDLYTSAIQPIPIQQVTIQPITAKAYVESHWRRGFSRRVASVICAGECLMPFTPFHFGPSGFVGLAFRKRIDLPVFVLANVAVDFEPGIVLLFALDHPVHGFCHTFLIGAGVGLVWAFAAFWARGIIKRLMHLFGLGYETSLGKVLVSAVLGVWFHVFLDSFCWGDVRPFWPSRANPFLDLMSIRTVYLLCTIFFVPAIGLYVYAVLARYSKREQAPDSRSVS